MDRETQFRQDDLEEARILRDSYKRKNNQGKEIQPFKHLKSGTTISVRLKYRTIATLASYLCKIDNKISPKGTVLRTILEQVAKNINLETTEHFFISDTEAINYLEAQGILYEGTSSRVDNSIFKGFSIDSLAGNPPNKHDFNFLELERIAVREMIKRGETPDPEVLKRLGMSNSKEQTTNPNEMAKLMALSSPTIASDASKASDACETIQETIKEGENND